MRSLSILSAAAAALLLCAPAWAHFGVIVPSDDIISQTDEKTVSLDIKFIHPMEGHFMDMARPAQCAVVAGGQREDLLATLKPKKVGESTTWQGSYRIKRPGDHVFVVEPAPYWEPAEECFIVHYTKVVVNALGLEEGWEEPVGLKTEIVPLTRPYGLWAGNVFQGVVLVGGKPVAGCPVEVEYLNTGGKVKPPADPYVTQVVKTDANGVFTYAMPRAGWWGFAALNEDDKKIEKDGTAYPVEIGAVLWVHTREMK